MKLNALLATALCVFAVSAPAAAQTVLRVNQWLPPNHMQLERVIRPWAAQVEAESGGRLAIRFTDASLGAPARQYDLAVDGIADVTFGVLGYTPGRFKLAGIAELPFVGEKAEDLSIALWKVHEAHFAKVDEYRDVRMLGIYANSTGHVMSTAAAGPVTSLAAYQGKKFRVGGGIVQQVNEALGGVNVAVAANETYELLSQGVVDGTLLPYEAYPSFNLTGVLKYSTRVPGGFYSSVWFLAMNRDKFDSLSSEDQEVLLRVSGENLARLAGVASDQADLDARAKMEADGVQFLTVDEAGVAAMRERLKKVEDQWIATAASLGVDGAAALAMMRSETMSEADAE